MNLTKETAGDNSCCSVGKSTLSEFPIQLAEHAIGGALTPGVIDVLRQIAAGNANKEIAVQFWISEDSVKRLRQEHSVEIG
jgi:DNA-binding NarL/FixJ family response regulator